MPDAFNMRGIIDVDVDRIASMSFHTIDKLTYKDPDDQSNKQLILARDKQLLKMFIVCTHRLNEDNLLPEDWNSHTIHSSRFWRFKMSQEPHTHILNCVCNNTYHKYMAAAALNASQTGVNPTGGTKGSNPTHPINVLNKHTTLLSEWKKYKQDISTRYP
jgi:hypothetical protein